MIHIPIMRAPMGTTLKENLISVWEFNETSGTDIFDSHASNDGSVQNATINQSGLSNLTPCYYFDGINDYSSIPHSQSLNFDGYTDSYSGSMWFKSSASKANYRFIEKWSGNGPYPLVLRYSTSSDVYGGMYIALYTGSTSVSAVISDNDTTRILDGNWHNVVFVVDNALGKIRIYFDGSLEAEVSNTLTSTTANSTDIYIASQAGVGSFVEAYIDQIGLWGRVLLSSEIEVLNNSGNGLAYTNW